MSWVSTLRRVYLSHDFWVILYFLCQSLANKGMVESFWRKETMTTEHLRQSVGWKSSNSKGPCFFDRFIIWETKGVVMKQQCWCAVKTTRQANQKGVQLISNYYNQSRLNQWSFLALLLVITNYSLRWSLCRFYSKYFLLYSKAVIIVGILLVDTFHITSVGCTSSEKINIDFVWNREFWLT